MALASRGLRDMDTGPAAIADLAELAQVRRQARKIHVRSAALAGGLVGLLLLIPS